MKTTLSKFAAASVAGLAVLGSVAVAEPVNAATIANKNSELSGLLNPLPEFPPNSPHTFGDTSCANGLVTSATQCVGVIRGANDVKEGGPNDPATKIVSSGVFDGIQNWTFNAKIDLNPTEVTGLNPLGFSISTDKDAKTGTFSFANENINWSLTRLAISLKGGPSYSIYYIPAGTFTTAPTNLAWNTLGIETGGGSPGPGLSHASVYYDVIPTPALLPGLIGMGAAALRKRKGEGDESAEA